MKNVKLILLVGTTMLFLGMGNVNAQQKESQTVIIRVFENTRGNSSKMIITSPDGSTNSIELETLNINSFEGNENNSIIMQSEINNWKNQGFSIDGLSSLSNYVGAIITTIILSKDE